LAQLWRLKPAERRQMLVARLALIAARSALPTAIRGRPKALSAREIAELYFNQRKSEPTVTHQLDLRRFLLSAVATELQAVAEERSVAAERRAGAKIRFALVDREANRLVLDREVACAASVDGTGVKFEKLGSAYSFTMGPEDPLEPAIRGCVRAFLSDALRA